MELKEFEVLLEKKLGDTMPDLVEKILKPFKEAQDNKLKQLFEETTAGKSAHKLEVAQKTIGLLRAVLHGDGVEAKALSEGTDADGGYLVHTEFKDEIQRLVPIYGIARRECRIWPMKAKTLTLPAMAAAGVLTGYWIGEGISKTATKWVLSQKSLTAKKCCAFVVAFDELLEDASGTDLGDIFDIIALLFAETLGGLEDTGLFNGAVGGPTGILPTSGTNAVTLTGTTFASLGTTDGIDKLLDMQTAIADGARDGKYFMHAQVFAYLQKMQATTYDSSHYGAFLYGSPGGPIPATLWGKPVELTDYMPNAAATAVNTKFVLFGNLRKCVAFGDRKRLTIDKSTEATVVDEAAATINLFQQDASALRAVERVDIVVTVPHGLSVLKTAAS